MNKETDLCATDGCHNKRISLSKHCGEHVVNAAYLTLIIQHLNNNTQHEDCNISDVELEPETPMGFMGHEFTDCTFLDFDVTRFTFKNSKFIGCEFSDIDLYQCSFEDCEFTECHFDQLSLYATHFIRCEFEQCEWDNCDVFEGSTLPGNRFELNRFTQFSIYDSEDLTYNHFEQCQFVLSTINYAKFDHSTIVYTEFSKTPLSYSSFRHATFTDIDQDFDEVGPPSACDFFGATVDPAIRESAKKDFCNFEQENFSKFVHDSISQILERRYSGNLSELSYFLHYIHSSDDSVRVYQAKTLSLFKYLYQEAVRLNDIKRIGNLIDDYSRLPDPITDQGFFLSAPQQSERNQARLVITFAESEGITFPVLVSINGVLSLLERQLFENDGASLETRSISQGSIIQEIIANYDKILVFSGALYAATNAVLSVVKGTAETQKILAETRKINAETKKINAEQDQEVAALVARNQVLEERIEDYQKLLSGEGIKLKESNKGVDEALKKFLKADNTVNQQVAKLDQSHKVEEIKVFIND